ncbi:peptidoglycan recognition protein family protein [Streptomyces sp. NPDC055078]
MRGFLASSIGVAASAVLVLPLSLPSGALAAPPHPAPPQPAVPAAVRAPDVPGSTQSLSLSPTARSLAPTGERRLLDQNVRPFSLVGVVWDDADAELHGTVQVRTRALGSGDWSSWQDVETHNHDHGADPGTAEGAPERTRGATAPLWVGSSDGVEVRVRAETPTPAGPVPLPAGMRLELVDPGEGGPEGRAALPPGSSSDDASRKSAENDGADGPDGPDDDSGGSDGSDGPDGSGDSGDSGGSDGSDDPDDSEETVVAARAAAAKPYIGPRPKIITRKGWGASESLREKGFVYTTKVKVAFVHHSATGNNYTCKQAPSVLRSIYRYHVVSSGWRDFGYNFAVDKCGNIYEGRAGGVTKAVLGAHTLGFNTNSMGIAVLGTYSRSNPPTAAVTAVARLTAWKLGLFTGNPKGKATLTSGGSGKYAKGKKVRFNVISGHRDGFNTDCPGSRLYKKLGSTRTASAVYQGRS